MVYSRQGYRLSHTLLELLVLNSVFLGRSTAEDSYVYHPLLISTGTGYDGSLCLTMEFVT